VPKCEIFDRSDFHEFYTIKLFWVGDFGVKYELKITLIFGGACHHLISDAHAEREQQFLIASSLHTSVPYAYAQHILKGPFQILNFYA
jgi:hypothetical protein